MHDGKNITELVVAYLSNELDPTGVQFVEQWMSESDANMEEFEAILAVWQAADPMPKREYNADLAWAKVDEEISRPSWWKSPVLRVAAGVVIILGLFGIINNFMDQPQPTTIIAQAETVQDTLSDGTMVQLNQNTELVFAEDTKKNIRKAKLDGEAYFDVARDTTKTFIVEMDQSYVKVLGTSFNIKANPDEDLVNVYVNSGIVMFEYLADTTDSSYLSIELRKGDRVTYDKKTLKLVPVDSAQVALDMFWVNRELIFDGISLDKVSRILETVYDVKIQFSDSITKQCLLTVKFDNASIDEIMEVIALTFELELESTDSGYILKGASCEKG